jgi:hypothetical protein
MKILFWASFSIQGILMVVDEFYFHWKRKLPKWERLGHPVDTFFYLIPLSILRFCESNTTWQITYIACAVVSSLVITKDEWVHREESPATEQWLHSLLFLLHPVVLITAFFVWSESQSQMHFQWVWALIFIFWIYQIIFWNFYADRILKT